MIELSVIRDLVAIFGVIAGFSYYVLTVRNSQKTRDLSLKAQEQTLETRQAQLFMYMYDRWSDPEFMKHNYEIQEWEWANYDDFWEKYGSSKNPDLYVHFGTIGRFLEGVGVLVKRGLVDPYLVDDLMSSHILRFWEKFGESIIKERQVRTNYPQYYEQIEYLAKIIGLIVEEQHPELKT